MHTKCIRFLHASSACDFELFTETVLLRRWQHIMSHDKKAHIKAHSNFADFFCMRVYKTSFAYEFGILVRTVYHLPSNVIRRCAFGHNSMHTKSWNDTILNILTCHNGFNLSNDNVIATKFASMFTKVRIRTRINASEILKSRLWICWNFNMILLWVEIMRLQRYPLQCIYNMDGRTRRIHGVTILRLSYVRVRVSASFFKI